MEYYKAFFLRRSLWVFLLILFLSPTVFSQVGFNNPNPDSSALIDMKANDKGLLIPRMKTTERELMTLGGKRVAHALMVFDTDKNLFFVYDTSSNPDRWLALNPWISEGNSNSNIVTGVNGNVGIGISEPSAKLEVNGNIKASGDIGIGGRIEAAGATLLYQLKCQSINTNYVNSSGDITALGRISANRFKGEGTVPGGAIIMWSGTSIPFGWALCNGSVINGFTTPDLRGRFIVGYDPSKPDYDNPGNLSLGGMVAADVGGEEKHMLTEAEMPKHNHSFDIAEKSSDEHESGTTGGGFKVGSGYTTIDTNTKGGNVAHENRPPYYTLAYIIKLPY